MKYKNNDVFVFVSSFYLFSHKPDDETLYVFNFKSKQGYIAYMFHLKHYHSMQYVEWKINVSNSENISISYNDPKS